MSSGMARPTELTKPLQSKLVKAIQAGVSIDDACRHAGIAPSTFYDWQARGKAGEPRYLEFSEAITCARVAAKVTAIGTLRSAMSPTQSVKRIKETLTETRFNPWGKEFEYKRTDEREIVTDAPGDWRAAVEYLKRRFPGEWGDKQTNFNLSVDPALLQKLMEAIEQANVDASDLFNELIAELHAQYANVGEDHG